MNEEQTPCLLIYCATSAKSSLNRNSTTAAGPALGQPAGPLWEPALFVGLDVHTESIAVSLAPSDTAEVRRF